MERSRVADLTTAFLLALFASMQLARRARGDEHGISNLILGIGGVALLIAMLVLDRRMWRTREYAVSITLAVMLGLALGAVL
jgi:uncharacterized membrane protein